LEIINNLMRLPLLAGRVLSNCRNQVNSIAEDIKDSTDMFVLGKGLATPMAEEGALKIKEVTTIHCEGHSVGELKHGISDLIVEDTPVILIVLNDEHKEAMKRAVKDVKAKKAKTIIITTDPYLVDIKDVDHLIVIEENGCLTPLLAIIPMQLLGYYTSIKRGLDPDNPPNLAKTVVTK
jgi:glucosamine--fructose-6-phosphate aminotransferase (isomerizing)